MRHSGIPIGRSPARFASAGLRSPCERVASFTGSRGRLAVEGLDLRWVRKRRRGPAGDGGSWTRVHVVRRPCTPRLLAAGRYSADTPGAEAQSPVSRRRALQPQSQALRTAGRARRGGRHCPRRGRVPGRRGLHGRGSASARPKDERTKTSRSSANSQGRSRASSPHARRSDARRSQHIPRNGAAAGSAAPPPPVHSTQRRSRSPWLQRFATATPTTTIC